MRPARLLAALSLALAGALAGALVATGARAHDARPVSIDVVEAQPGVYRAEVRAPPLADASNTPRLVWPEDCSVEDGNARDVGGATLATSLATCPGGLAGRALEIAYPIYNPALTTLLRVRTADGRQHTAVLPPDQLSWRAPEDPSWRMVARDYFALGVTHIWGGPDHLLFVAGLMLLARTRKRILLAVTGFTLAHSITLTLATVGLVRAPIPPVEAMIALSILFLAAEVARDDSASFSRRFPIVLSFVFGLLHGLGFASALAEIGLPAGDLALGLASFNLGVEAGQLAFVAAAALAWTAASGALAARAFWPRARGGAETFAVYGLGITSAFWFFQRLANLGSG